MTDTQTLLDTFAGWLRELADDALALADRLDDESLPTASREYLAGGLNYLFKSLDLIPDGIDDIGYLDDAFVLRVAADLALEECSPTASSEREFGRLGELAEQTEVLRSFLEEDYGRLEAYVKGLRTGASRGRSAEDIVADPKVREEMRDDVRGFARSYEPPGFRKEEKNLVKLKAFFDAKLPR